MNNSTDYLNKYIYDWDFFNIMIGGESSLDTPNFIPHLSNIDQITEFIKSYGIDITDSVAHAELFGNFQEALQFIRKYFLKEGSVNGYDLSIPNSILMVTDIRSLFMLASSSNKILEEKLWAEVILKVVHTILHVDKDIRSRYFATVQTQILDRYYKNISRNSKEELLLKDANGNEIELVKFETKSKKTRDSVIIKLLHKAEHVAEELFDRIGIRIITKNKFDTLRVLKFLSMNNIVIPHNVKPSRSMNTLYDLEEFKSLYSKYLKTCIKNKTTEEEFLVEANKLLELCNNIKASDRNSNSLKNYHSIQFTCRQLIYYKNPLFNDIQAIRKMAREEENKESPLIKKIFNLDISKMAIELKFFYPYEIQIIDAESHNDNMHGEASHEKYKEKQVLAARNRVFKAFYKEGLLK